ncbi:MAG: hypothetical protein KGI50_08210, partial [Patescibacteria group bacterium]|nr:hypothetical protein [Patescibacteria group bacterium]
DRASSISQGIIVATDGSTVTFNLDNGTIQQETLGGNRTLALAGTLTVGRIFAIKLTQDATGSRTVTWWSGITWAAGSAPTLSTAASASDWFCFIIKGTNLYDGFILGQGM